MILNQYEYAPVQKSEQSKLFMNTQVSEHVVNKVTTQRSHTQLCVLHAVRYTENSNLLKDTSMSLAANEMI